MGPKTYAGLIAEHFLQAAFIDLNASQITRESYEQKRCDFAHNCRA